VGRPDSRKVAILSGKDGGVVLSDCLFGLSCANLTDAKRIRKRLLDNWARMESAFGGSCAPFLTLARLQSALSTMNIATIQGD
jgi:hypothetical protein